MFLNKRHNKSFERNLMLFTQDEHVDKSVKRDIMLFQFLFYFLVLTSFQENDPSGTQSNKLLLP